MAQYILALLISLGIGFGVNSSIRIISDGDEALVARLGKYNRTLKPGLQFVIPVIEKIVHYDTLRERLLDIPKQEAITKDNVPLTIDALVFWKIQDMRKSFYDIQGVEDAIANLVTTTLRAEVGLRNMEDMFSSINEINTALLHSLAEKTVNWGVQVVRVDLQSIEPPAKVKLAMEAQRAAESQKKADISIAEGKAASIKVLAEVLNLDPNSREFLQFLIAKQFVDANQQISMSENAKVIFMDPSQLTEALTGLIDQDMSRVESQAAMRAKLFSKGNSQPKE
ncbi:MAG: SPFH domain-containing protein [Limnospira sp. PMC 1291.21]|uniref:Band 7 protein n=2 Tax=Limnospira TaxID=2596745 RepID=B5W174_LIMMA|nr:MULTISPECIES: paraslipin [Limnospira]EKD05905.1 band 7 protein [Arthrospira platensis C1]MBD2671123.1 paraslipin [Arthrospira platensis FACHB-439]MDC0839910.1 SPFH domain-containing protein [Limnoraphis robusta]MDY7054377.1 SPFH domain-containing protein [Limnospira fusiformis LS22]QJB27046.1 paraslipin [Limnospira fusiformis SAG 85.79]